MANIINGQCHQYELSLKSSVHFNKWNWRKRLLTTNAIDDKHQWWQMPLMIYAIGTFCQLQQLTNSIGGKHPCWQISSKRVGTEKLCPFQKVVLTKKIIGDKCYWWQMPLMIYAVDDICHWNLLSVATTYKFHRWQTSLMANVINKSWHWKVLTISTNDKKLTKKIIGKKCYWW